MLSAASTRIFAAALLASFLPGVKADCWQDSYVYLSQHIRKCLFPLNLISSFPLITLGMGPEPVTE